jgi:hypothetical protein
MNVIQSEVVIASAAAPAHVYPSLAPACSRLLDFCVVTLVGILVLPVVCAAVIAIKLVDPDLNFTSKIVAVKTAAPSGSSSSAPCACTPKRGYSTIWLRVRRPGIRAIAVMPATRASCLS